jgi:hypothetical protein
MSRHGIVFACSASSLFVAMQGCASLPANHARLIGSRALDLTGAYIRVAAFNRGAFAAEDHRGAAILVGPQAVLLFDYRGCENRFDLLIVKDSQSILYERLAQRPATTADASRISSPVGIHIDREAERLEGRFDVVVGRADRCGFGPAFEHYPRYLRVVGAFLVSREAAPPGPPTSQPFWYPPSPAASRRVISGLADVDKGWLMRSFANDLPELPKTGRSVISRTP